MTPDIDGFLTRVVVDGSELALTPLLFGAVLLTRGPASGWTMCTESWTFDHPSAALLAYAELVADPAASVDGWVRYVGAGRPTRRRSPCRVCGRILEYGNDENGIAEPPPACDHAAGIAAGIATEDAR